VLDRNHLREQWFNEGGAEYYAFRIALKLGPIGKDEIPARLGLPIGYYLNDSGIGSLSMSEAGEGQRMPSVSSISIAIRLFSMTCAAVFHLGCFILKFRFSPLVQTIWNNGLSWPRR